MVFLVAAVAIGEGDPGVDPNDPAERIARRLAADSDDNKLAFPLYGLAVYLIQGLVQAAQFSIDDYGADVQVAKALFALEWNFAMLLGPPVAAMMGAAAAVILRFGVLPKWLGWLAALSFLTAIVMPWVPFFALWVLLVSIVLLVERRRNAVPTVTAATA